MRIHWNDPNFLVLIKGAGDLASGVAVRLYRCGFRLAMTEIPHPLTVRRTVSFGEAVYKGITQVEGIRSIRVEDTLQARKAMADGKIPILVDPKADCRTELRPVVVVDAIMAKYNTGTQIIDAPIVIGLGPGFFAGFDCHAVVETNRGHHLGRVITLGGAEPDTGQPATICGKAGERVIRAPVAGIVEPQASIGDRVTEGQIVARVGTEMVFAQISGIVRGMIRCGVRIPAGTKIGDIDPRNDPSLCDQVSDKALSVAGGVLEAILMLQGCAQIPEETDAPVQVFAEVSQRE